MTIKCKIRNDGPSRQVFFDADGAEVMVEPTQTVEATVTEGTFRTLKRYFDDKAHGLNLVEADVGPSSKDENDETKAEKLISSTKIVPEADANKPNPPVTGGPANTEDLSASHDDSIEKLLADVDAESINFAQLRSRAKTLLGDDFPSGYSPKKDEIVELLHAAQDKKKARG